MFRVNHYFQCNASFFFRLCGMSCARQSLTLTLSQKTEINIEVYMYTYAYVCICIYMTYGWYLCMCRVNQLSQISYIVFFQVVRDELREAISDADALAEKGTNVWEATAPGESKKNRLHRQFIIQRGHEHTHIGSCSESGFGSLMGAPLNISRCLDGSYTRANLLYPTISHESHHIPPYPLFSNHIKNGISTNRYSGGGGVLVKEEISQKQRNKALPLAHAQTILYTRN